LNPAAPPRIAVQSAGFGKRVPNAKARGRWFLRLVSGMVVIFCQNY